MKKIACLLLTVLVYSIMTAQTTKSQWVNLFNGKDLKGFKQLNGHAKYSVKNGEIIGSTVFGEPNSFLATEKTYGDFILELDLKLFANMNSGIQFRSETAPGTQQVNGKTIEGRVFGYQMEVDPSDRAWSGGIYDEGRRDWLYPLDFNADAKKAFKPRDWNHYRIECFGNSIRTWINGVPCAALIDDLTAKGFIALQVHAIKNKEDEGKEIHWKNIRIQTENIKPSPVSNIFIANLIPNTVSEDEKKLGYKLLFDGSTTNGWRGLNMDHAPAVWSVENGELIVHNTKSTKMEGGDLATPEEYAAFDLQFEFKLTDTANSGVKYYVVEDPKNKGGAVGLEYQILDDAKHPDAKAGVVGNRTMSSLYDLIPAANMLDVKANRRDRLAIGKWNRGRIIAHPDGTVEHWLNGFKMVEYKRGTPIFYALVARSKYSHYDNFGMAPKGHIILQDHSDKVSFRSIKIKEL